MALEQTQKDAILANLSSVLSSEEGQNRIANFIVCGDITWDELANTGMLTPAQRSTLQAIVDSLSVSHAEDQLWQQAEEQYNIALNSPCDALYQKALTAYQEYLKQYSNGKYTSRANMTIVAIRTMLDSSKKYQYIQDLKDDINAYNTIQLNAYNVTFNDLVNNGVCLPNQIKDIWDNSGFDLDYGDTPDSIPSGRTEIYFWGAPGSGKTCTLAAILSTAQKRGFYAPQEGTGLMYMNQLSNLFINDTATLPKPSPVEITQALSFNLRDKNLDEHPVSLIEISGEIFECFSYAITGKPIPDDGHLSAYLSLLNFLQSTDNPKYHFFIIDVNNTTLDCFGQSQMTYLQNAALFFNNNNIFNDKTAGINILVTKSDLLTNNKSERSSAAIQILRNNYVNFVNSLKSIANQHKLIRSLNDMIPVIPFTLGEVYLKDKCIFDPEMSDEVIRILQENVAMKQKRNKWGWLNR
jgi:hypothetical protein